jgi:hypothetical protein
LLRPGAEHQLEEHALFELLDRIEDGPALVPANRPRREDAAGREHVDAKRDISYPTLPDGLSSLLFVQAQLSFPAGREGSMPRT